MTAEMTLIQLKAQLSILELQSSDTVIDMYKLVAEKASEAYADAQKALADLRRAQLASA